MASDESGISAAPPQQFAGGGFSIGSPESQSVIGALQQAPQNLEAAVKSRIEALERSKKEQGMLGEYQTARGVQAARGAGIATGGGAGEAGGSVAIKGMREAAAQRAMADSAISDFGLQGTKDIEQAKLLSLQEQVSIQRQEGEFPAVFMQQIMTDYTTFRGADGNRNDFTVAVSGAIQGLNYGVDESGQPINPAHRNAAIDAVTWWANVMGWEDVDRRTASMLLDYYGPEAPRVVSSGGGGESGVDKPTWMIGGQEGGIPNQWRVDHGYGSWGVAEDGTQVYVPAAPTAWS